jgi:hypothetical protein
MNSSGIHMFSKCILCNLAHLVGFDVHLLTMQTYCCKANHSTHVKLQRMTKSIFHELLQIFTTPKYGPDRKLHT